MRGASRITRSSDNSFRRITELKQQLRNDGRTFVDLSEGIPDSPPDETLRVKLGQFCRQPHNHGYPTRRGITLLRERILDHLVKQFGATAHGWDCLPAAGSKELIGHITQAVVDPDSVVLLPELHYPIYRNAAEYAGAKIQIVPMDREKNFAPCLSALPESVLRDARLLWVNSPNNPTGTAIDGGTLRSLIQICQRNDIVLAHDVAYSHIRFDGGITHSVLTGQCDGVVELHSLSKSVHVPGWRAAFLAGDPQLVKLVELSKAVFDTGIFVAMQKAMCYALHNFETHTREVCRIYAERVEFMSMALRDIGIAHIPPQGTFFIWCEIPTDEGAMEFTERLLSETGVLAMPGSAFGKAGKRHFRLALTQPMQILEEVVTRLREVTQ